ncbi:MAG: DinB family protein [Deinococcota bacterium]
MDKWQHLFITGEYASPEKILSGLTLEQVTYVPSDMSHSIYEELWHLVAWQHIVVFRDESPYKVWEGGDLYPTQQATSEKDWHDLVDRFNGGLREVFVWTSSDENLNLEIDSGITMADELVSLAVHNAYHLGKIVAIRQLLGVWPSV